MARPTRPHIGIFGRRNNGKSSLINKISGQEISIVSDFAGTTTDPVKKNMEITGLGPVVIIDTAGIDDSGELGKKRVEKTLQALKTVDLAILVITGNQFATDEELLLKEFNKFDLPYFIIHNKSDLEKLSPELRLQISAQENTEIIDYSAKSDKDAEDVIALIKKYLPPTAYHKPTIVGDLVNYGDLVLLVTPIDIEAPEGRLILPQVQTIRDILDNDCISVVLKERELDHFFKNYAITPKLVITDSQEFLKVSASVPTEIPLTSFSILFARLKGDFNAFLNGTPAIAKLQNGDKVLILESCSHHVSCDDIGRAKIPRWLSAFSGKQLQYEIIAGLDPLPANPEDYALVVQCGGCMVTAKQLKNRIKVFTDLNIPVTNYGMTIAYLHGIFNRAVAPFTQNDTSDYL